MSTVEDNAKEQESKLIRHGHETCVLEWRCGWKQSEDSTETGYSRKKIWVEDIAEEKE